MRFFIRVVLTSLFAASLLAVPAGADHGIHGPDGVTARIAPVQVLVPDANGNHVFEVEIFQKDAAGWTRVGMGATLRVFAHDASQWHDVVSMPFASDAGGPLTLSYPAREVGHWRSLDVFVTFSSLGGDPVPTSHHSEAKNAAIAQGDHDAADALDYHGAHILLAI